HDLGEDFSRLAPQVFLESRFVDLATGLFFKESELRSALLPLLLLFLLAQVEPPVGRRALAGGGFLYVVHEVRLRAYLEKRRAVALPCRQGDVGPLPDKLGLV